MYLRLNVEIFSGGGTGTYNIDHETPGFTDVQGGSYVFLDAQYLAIGGEDDDKMYATRKDRVEAVWQIAGRGKNQ
jgi:D-serine deaminase-like pyridoxal phosphate-dependent protein